LDANNGVPHCGTPLYEYLKWVLFKSDCCKAPILSNWEGPAYEDFFKAHDQFMAAKKELAGDIPTCSCPRIFINNYSTGTNYIAHVSGNEKLQTGGLQYTR